jgi:hypothetical protein
MPAGRPYPVAPAVVGTEASRAVEGECGNRCLAYPVSRVRDWRGSGPRLGLATPGAAGAWAARAALEAGPHDEALLLVDELVALSSRPLRWPRVADAARGCRLDASLARSERRPQTARERFGRLAVTPAPRRLVTGPATNRSPGPAPEVPPAECRVP